MAYAAAPPTATPAATRHPPTALATVIGTSSRSAGIPECTFGSSR